MTSVPVCWKCRRPGSCRHTAPTRLDWAIVWSWAIVLGVLIGSWWAIWAGARAVWRLIS